MCFLILPETLYTLQIETQLCCLATEQVIFPWTKVFTRNNNLQGDHLIGRNIVSKKLAKEVLPFGEIVVGPFSFDKLAHYFHIIIDVATRICNHGFCNTFILVRWFKIAFIEFLKRFSPWKSVYALKCAISFIYLTDQLLDIPKVPVNFLIEVNCLI